MDESRWIAHEADRIANHILHSDLEWIDIEIMIDRLRRHVTELFPDRAELFEHVYTARFERLWHDWHGDVIG